MAWAGSGYSSPKISRSPRALSMISENPDDSKNSKTLKPLNSNPKRDGNSPRSSPKFVRANKPTRRKAVAPLQHPVNVLLESKHAPNVVSKTPSPKTPSTTTTTDKRLKPGTASSLKIRNLFPSVSNLSDPNSTTRSVNSRNIDSPVLEEEEFMVASPQGINSDNNIELVAQSSDASSGTVSLPLNDKSETAWDQNHNSIPISAAESCKDSPSVSIVIHPCTIVEDNNNNNNNNNNRSTTTNNHHCLNSDSISLGEPSHSKSSHSLFDISSPDTDAVTSSSNLTQAVLNPHDEFFVHSDSENPSSCEEVGDCNFCTSSWNEKGQNAEKDETFLDSGVLSQETLNEFLPTTQRQDIDSDSDFEVSRNRNCVPSIDQPDAGSDIAHHETFEFKNDSCDLGNVSDSEMQEFTGNAHLTSTPIIRKTTRQDFGHERVNSSYRRPVSWRTATKHLQRSSTESDLHINSLNPKFGSSSNQLFSCESSRSESAMSLQHAGSDKPQEPVSLDGDTLEWRKRVKRSVSLIKINQNVDKGLKRRVSSIHSSRESILSKYANSQSNASENKRSSLVLSSHVRDLEGNPDISQSNNDRIRRISAIDQSDFRLLKVTAKRLNLPTRRPSVLAWKEKYLKEGSPLRIVPSKSEQIVTKKENSIPKEDSDSEKGKYNWKLTEEDRKRINGTLSWLRQELINIRLQDQSLARQFLTLRHAMNEFRLKVEYEDHQELIEEAEEDMVELRELSQLVDLPPEILTPLSPLKHVGVTRMNISARRFSTC